jgi:LysM repeat protein
MKKFFYRVEKDETLFSISEKFRIPPIKIIFDNNLKAELLEGDLLYIEIGDDYLYTVTATDTISSISSRFNIPEEKILLDNNLPYIFYGLTITIKNN